MPSFQGLLQRWGFVKLRRYGLELTPDGRILSTRPAVLDDGTGNPIVGWRDGDVSIWKFSSWRAEATAEATEGAPVASPVAMPQPAAPPVAPAPARPSAAVMAADVAGEPTLDEDDWEWTIALARARASVDEAESARPPEPPSRPVRSQPRAPERITPLALAARDSASSAEWPKTELIGAIDYDDDTRIPTRTSVVVPRSAPVAVAIPRTKPPTPPPPLPTTAPTTVIPVPALPSLATMTPGRSRMEPVVRSPVPPASASRFAKGTGPVDPPPAPPLARAPAVIVEDTIPNLSVGDRTRPGVAMPPAPQRTEAAGSSVGDRTRPGIALPPAARAVELPSIKRRMSQR